MEKACVGRDETSSTRSPTPALWLAAWSAQGLVVFLVEQFVPGTALAKTLVIGPLAGLPLLALYLHQRRFHGSKDSMSTRETR